MAAKARARWPTVVRTMLAAMVTMSQRVKKKLRRVPPIILAGRETP